MLSQVNFQSIGALAPDHDALLTLTDHVKQYLPIRLHKQALIELTAGYELMRFQEGICNE